MPGWTWWAIGGAGAAIVLAGAVLLVLVAWRRQVRRYVMRLVAHREAVRAGMRTLASVLARLAEDADEALVAFVSDERHLDRKALAEVRRQQEILRDELRTIALQKRLWPVADVLGAAAGVVSREAGRVGEHAPAEDVLTALAEIDLAAAQSAVDAADRAVHEMCERFDVDDAAVYGGGLYI